MLLTYVQISRLNKGSECEQKSINHLLEVLDSRVGQLRLPQEALEIWNSAF